jgi:hypothetical protein
MKTIQLPIYKLAFLLLSFYTSLSFAAVEEIEKEFDVKPGGTLTINSDQGAINILTSSQNQVLVHIKKKAKKESRLANFTAEIEQQGNDIVIEGDGDWNSKVSVTFTITVPSEYNLDLKTGGGAISIDDISGEIKLKTSGGSIKVADMARGSLDADTSGGSISVGDINGNIKVNTSGGSINVGNITGTSKIETSGGSIKVESAKNDVTADTAGGSINIGNVEGNVKVDTSGGSIKVGETTGDVIAETSGGSIKIKASKGKVTADTSGGSVTVEGSGGPVSVNTAGGNVTILKANGAIVADTAGGAIKAEMIATSGDTSIHLESSGGPITLYIKASLAATIDADLVTRSSRDYRIYSDFPITINNTDNNKIKAKGDINGGGDKIRLSTINGDIHIKKIKD